MNLIPRWIWYRLVSVGIALEENLSGEVVEN